MEKRDFTGGPSEGKVVEQLERQYKGSKGEKPEANSRGLFGNCNTFEQIDARIQSLPPGKNIIGSNNEPVNFTWFYSGRAAIEQGSVFNGASLKPLSKNEGLRPAVGRAIKAHFESENFFARCASLNDILARLEIVNRQNVVLTDFRLPLIELKGADGQILLLDSAVKGEKIRVVGFVDFLKGVQNGMYTAQAEVISTAFYKVLPAGLKAAVDRSIQYLP
jgi:hypothetical protein